MQTTIYADGIANTQLIDGVVRFDLIKMTPVTEEKMTVQTSGAIAMSLPAFLRAYDQLGSLINALVEKGQIQKTAPKEIASSDLPETVKSTKSTSLKDVLKKTQ
ncbi:hypothetical protein [Polynucleobacter aenigmaticus]|uniref:hypothetical protein n=1 Tax=Polynucleobacter aenigmaticus TaxID=1743164 RepID=UPI00197DFB7E|nr:hypothetical protein [Polynucleobacter aenigmaticus]